MCKHISGLDNLFILHTQGNRILFIFLKVPKISDFLHGFKPLHKETSGFQAPAPCSVTKIGRLQTQFGLLIA